MENFDYILKKLEDNLKLIRKPNFLKFKDYDSPHVMLYRMQGQLSSISATILALYNRIEDYEEEIKELEKDIIILKQKILDSNKED